MSKSHGALILLFSCKLAEAIIIFLINLFMRLVIHVVVFLKRNGNGFVIKP